MTLIRFGRLGLPTGLFASVVSALQIWMPAAALGFDETEINRGDRSHHPGPQLVDRPADPIVDSCVDISVVLALPVPPNALGDLDDDAVVDIVDLLRLRDIVVGFGSPATDYEAVEGDLSGDGLVAEQDVDGLRDALLLRVGLPHIIGLSGGVVTGNRGRTTFTIPPGLFDEPRRMTAEDYPTHEFEEAFGASLSVLGEDVAYLAGAKLRILDPREGDDALRGVIELAEQVSPGAVVDTLGTNALFNVQSDFDGDGVPELSLLGDLSPSQDMSQ